MRRRPLRLAGLVGALCGVAALGLLAGGMASASPASDLDDAKRLRSLFRTMVVQEQDTLKAVKARAAARTHDRIARAERNARAADDLARRMRPYEEILQIRDALSEILDADDEVSSTTFAVEDESTRLSAAEATRLGKVLAAAIKLKKAQIKRLDRLIAELAKPKPAPTTKPATTTAPDDDDEEDLGCTTGSVGGNPKSITISGCTKTLDHAKLMSQGGALTTLGGSILPGERKIDCKPAGTTHTCSFTDGLKPAEKAFIDVDGAAGTRVAVTPCTKTGCDKAAFATLP